MPYPQQKKRLTTPITSSIVSKKLLFFLKKKERKKERTKKKTTQAKIEKWQILDNLSFKTKHMITKQKRNKMSKRVQTSYKLALLVPSSHSLRRSIPAFFATASSPFFSMVFNALVERRSFRYRFPPSHQTLLYCRFTNCSFLVLWLECETLLALLAFFPVKGQILPDQWILQYP